MADNRQMILCGGEALIDMIPGEAGSGRACFIPHGGGSVYNTAVALGRLGMEAGLVAGLSSDLFGKLLRDELISSKVSLDYVVTRDLPTTLAFVSIEDGQAKYAFYDENTASRMLTDDLLPDIPDAASAVFVGGISLIAEPCGSAFEELAARAAGRTVVMCDPNVRPGFIEDEAAYRSRLQRLWNNSDIIKASEDDIDWLSGGMPDPEGFAKELLDEGVTLVIVTSGEAGSTGYTRTFSVSVPATFSNVVDTVGAGDAFNAGVLTSLCRNGMLSKPGLESLSRSGLERVLGSGNKVAAASVARQGADPPWLDDVHIH